MKALAGLLTILIILCSPLSAQIADVAGFTASLGLNSYSYFGGSARAMAMGYAFVGLANDASSGIWNPAGLWTLESPIVAGSYNVYVPGGSFTQSITPGVTNNDIDKSGLGHFSFVAPARIKGHPFVFNFNFDRTNEYTSDAFYDGIVSTGEVNYHQKDLGHVLMYSFGASTRIYKQVSLGLLANIWDGRRLTDFRTEYSTEIVIDPVYGTTQQMVNSVSIIDSVTSTGVNFIGGLMLKEDKFSVGAVVHTPFTLKHSDFSSNQLITTRDGLLDNQLSGTVYKPDSLTKQDVPFTITTGLGLFPSEKLTMTLDINYQNYSSTNWYYRTGYIIDAGGDRTDYFQRVPIDWNNTFGIGAGAEYRLDFGFGEIPLRAGLRYDQLPQPKDFTITASNVGFDQSGNAFPYADILLTASSSGRQDEMSFSLGSGIAWSQIRFDFAYRYTAGKKLSETVNTIYYDETQPNNVAYTHINYFWERKASEFRATMTGYF